MPYRLIDNERVTSDLQRIAREQIDRAIGEIDDQELGRHHTVHQVRKRCKKIRGLLRLVRGALSPPDLFDHENAWFRDSARSLSYIRDAEALIETYGKLIARFGEVLDLEACESIRDQLEARRRKIADDELGLEDRLRCFRERMLNARERTPEWKLATEGFDALAPGLEKTYRRARKAFAKTREDPNDETFHEWRKRVKYHWYHCRLLRDTWPRVMRARRDEADRLADLLGDEHDLAVLQQTLRDENEQFGDFAGSKALLGLAGQRRRELQGLADALGRRLLAEKAKYLSKRLEAYWSACERLAPEA